MKRIFNKKFNSLANKLNGYMQLTVYLCVLVCVFFFFSFQSFVTETVESKSLFTNDNYFKKLTHKKMEKSKHTK